MTLRRGVGDSGRREDGGVVWGDASSDRGVAAGASARPLEIRKPRPSVLHCNDSFGPTPLQLNLTVYASSNASMMHIHNQHARKSNNTQRAILRFQWSQFTRFQQLLYRQIELFLSESEVELRKTLTSEYGVGEFRNECMRGKYSFVVAIARGFRIVAADPAINRKCRRVQHHDQANDNKGNVSKALPKRTRDGSVVQQRLGSWVSKRTSSFSSGSVSLTG